MQVIYKAQFLKLNILNHAHRAIPALLYIDDDKVCRSAIEKSYTGIIK